MCDAERSPVQGLALVTQCTIEKPGGGGDWVKVREVRLSPDRAQTRECSRYIDVRTVHQIERILVVDGRNSKRLSVDDDGAQGNERDSDEREDSKSLADPAWRLGAFIGVRG